MLGGLIILVALAAGWAVMHQQSQRAYRERRNPVYQMVPALKACGVHLTGDQQHMLGHHGSVAVPFKELDRRGQSAVLEAVKKVWLERHAGGTSSPAERQKQLDEVLASSQNGMVGFQREAPGSAYVFLASNVPPLPLHMVPGAKHLEQAHIELHTHGEMQHGQWEREQIQKGFEETPAPKGGP
jgi:hypothetical protein